MRGAEAAPNHASFSRALGCTCSGSFRTTRAALRCPTYVLPLVEGGIVDRVWILFAHIDDCLHVSPAPMLGAIPSVAAAPAAASITVSRTLALLDGPFASFAESVAQARYAFWVGSGISRDRVDDVPKLVRRILTNLQSQISPHAGNCKFRRCLEQNIELAQPSDDELRGINLSLRPDEWADLPALVKRLASR